MRALKLFVSSVLGGACIGLGGVAYLSLENRLAGALFFTVGLFTICTFGFHLFTGKVCYVFQKGGTDPRHLPLIWLGNLAGTGAVAAAVRLTRLAPLAEKAAGLCRVKLEDSLPSVFLLAVLCKKAEENKGVILPGYTHLQRAQPITFGHHLMAYAAMLCRDLDRLADVKKRMNVLPLGSGALAGTTYPIDRQMVAAQLGFDDVSANSLDGVSDRDFCIELAAALSLVMVHLSRFSEEIIMWCSWEFKFVELDDAFSTGSSIMPQKKNPDIAELVRGKSGRVFGDLTTLLTVMKGIALAYNKDMQEDKEAIFDAVDTVKMCLHAFTPMIDTMTVLKDNMRAAAAKGFINATDCADYLVGKGLPFRDAYKATGELVAQCIDRGLTLETLPLEDYRAVCDLFDQDVYHKINLDTCVATRISEGGPCPESVERQIGKVQAFLDKYPL